LLEGNIIIAGKTISTRDAMGIWDTTQFDMAIEQDASFIVIEVPVNH
jgi:hypothetical protein